MVKVGILRLFFLLLVALPLLILVITLIVFLLKKSGKAGLWFFTSLTVLMLVFAGLFVLRLRPHIVRVIPQSSNYVNVVRSNIQQPSDITPAVWLPGIEDQFEADVYPSLYSAAEALGRVVAQMLPKVVVDNQAPNTVQIIYRNDNGHLKPEVLNAAAQGLRDSGVVENILVETVYLSQNQRIENIDKKAVTLEITLPKYSLDKRNLKGGTVSMNISGAAGNLTRTAAFTEKPWVENFADFLNQNPQKQWIVARSNSGCTSETQAAQQAINDASVRISSLLRQMQQPYQVNHMDIINRGFIADRFTQSFNGIAGRIWRQAVLIDTSPEKIAALVKLKIKQLRSQRVTWARMFISIVGLTVLICVVYLFLNAATKGYYSIALRIAAIVLACAGIFLIMIIS